MLPRRFASAHDAYQTAVHEELESPLPVAMIADLKRYFEARKHLTHASFDAQAEAVFKAGARTFSTPRFDDLYRRWITHGDEVFTSPSSAVSPTLKKRRNLDGWSMAGAAALTRSPAAFSG